MGIWHFGHGRLIVAIVASFLAHSSACSSSYSAQDCSGGCAFAWVKQNPRPHAVHVHLGTTAPPRQICEWSQYGHCRACSGWLWLNVNRKKRRQTSGATRAI